MIEKSSITRYMCTSVPTAFSPQSGTGLEDLVLD